MIRNTNQAQQSEQIYVEKVSRLRRLEIMEIFKSVVEEKQRSYQKVHSDLFVIVRLQSHSPILQTL
jgi:hypothetical protein